MSVMTSAGGTRRAELGAFLRSRRERITPEDVGLPPGIRRRTAGLRREEVAMLAGVGVTWYTWLEQGRPINASTQVLDAVARTLKLDQPEREHLYRLADVPEAAAVAADGAAQAGQVAPEMQRILDGLTTLPASIMNERFDILAWNHAYAALFPGVVRQPACERNSLWLSFTYAPCCHPYLNRAEQLGMLVAQLRAAYGRHVGEAAWTKFVRRLQAASPEFSKLWAQHEVASPSTYLKIFRHPAHERLVMTTSSLAILAAPGTRMVVYTPADDETCKAVASLIAGEGADMRFPCWPEHHRLLEEDDAALAAQ
ncbi:MAG: helix-turn-helix transcriptional regulator [Nocardiopsaceae bacterium]|jgi:transcriptional regulator with XRE-family HTH domain|nr:helix-turn-helix transcriptional regulator [Nocardiopsaceae bacterium]